MLFMRNKSSVTRTLGPVSASFINELQKCGKTIFTLVDALNVYDKRRSEVIAFLTDLVNRGILARLKPGVFLILQMGQETTQLSNWPIIARELAGSDDYCISHYSAMRLHGMTTHSLVDVYITMSKRRRRTSKKIDNITYRFVYSKPEHFWGDCVHWATRNEKVSVSDIERTLLDGLERPDLCGGLEEVIRGIWSKQKEIDWEKLAAYAEKFRTKAAVKRLGFILETLDLGVDCIPNLKKTITLKKGYIFLDPNGSKQGSYLSRWHIRLNVNAEELKAGVWR